MLSQTLPSLLAGATFSVAVISPAVEAEDAPFKKGDRVVTTSDAPLQQPGKIVGTASAGTEVVAEFVEGNWIWVTVNQDGETIEGWINKRYFSTDPEKTSMMLTMHQQSDVGAAKRWFGEKDKNADGELGPDEFVAARQTLEDLNRRLLEIRDQVDKQFKDDPLVNAFLLKSMLVQEIRGELGETRFNGWKREITLNEAWQLADDLVKTEDLRDSRLAQQLVTFETPQKRTEIAQAMFRWADKNGDNKLSMTEFQRALGILSTGNAPEEKGAP